MSVKRKNGTLRAGALGIRETARLAPIDGRALWLSTREFELLGPSWSESGVA